MNEALLLSPHAARALAELVGVGLFQARDDDAVAVLEALRDRTELATEVRFLDAWLAMRRGDFHAAVSRLRTLADSGDIGGKAPLCRALLAASLFVLDDAEWRGVAESVSAAGGHPLAAQLARQLLGVVDTGALRDTAAVVDTAAHAEPDIAIAAMPAEPHRANLFLRA